MRDGVSIVSMVVAVASTWMEDATVLAAAKVQEDVPADVEEAGAALLALSR